MPNYKIKLSEPERLFTAFGHLKDGDVVTADEQPGDGVTWTWSETTAKKAEPVAETPAVPDSAQPPVITPPQVPAEPIS